MLSLVTFPSASVRRLIEIGEADAVARIADIRRFLEGPPNARDATRASDRGAVREHGT